MNGDQAVYLDQAARFAISERWTHALYVALHIGWGSPWRSDLLTLACAGVATAWITSHYGKDRGVVLAVALSPWMAFGEVDVPWFLGVVLASSAREPLAALAVALAVGVSPTALVALPWLLVARRDRAVFGGVAMVVLLTVLSGGDWWVGRRGVLTSDYTRAPLAQLGPGLLAALALARTPSRAEALALLPVLLAPSDVPAGLVLVLAVVRGRRIPLGSRASVVGRSGLLVLGVVGLLGTRARIAREMDGLRAASARLDPTDEIHGSWSDRVRTSLWVTGRQEGFARSGEGTRRFRVDLDQRDSITRW